jgi:hypothetical protein
MEVSAGPYGAGNRGLVDRPSVAPARWVPSRLPESTGLGTKCFLCREPARGAAGRPFRSPKLWVIYKQGRKRARRRVLNAGAAAAWTILQL